MYCIAELGVTKTEIILPTYWKELVDWTTITVNLTPIGAHQNVIVKRIDEEKYTSKHMEECQLIVSIASMALVLMERD